MKTFRAWFFLTLFLVVSCGGNPASSSGKPETAAVPKVVVDKEKSEKEPPLPPEVKIKLKRDGKDNYSWELSGSDADQILKVNEKMRKRLISEKPQ